MKPLTSIPSAEIAAAFLGASADRQSNLLSYDWGRLRLPAMVKALETIAAEPETGKMICAMLSCGGCMNWTPIKAGHTYSTRSSISAQILREIDPACFSESGDRLPSRGIQGTEGIHDAGKNIATCAVCPVSKSRPG